MAVKFAVWADCHRKMWHRAEVLFSVELFAKAEPNVATKDPI
jgi:hypothetical protein